MNMDKKPDNKTFIAYNHKPPEIKPKMFVYEFLDLSTTIDGSPYVEGTFAPHLHMKGIRSRRKTIRVVPYRVGLLYRGRQVSVFRR